MRAHLEFVGGRSAKFWEVSVAGTTMTVRFGRIGTTGQEKVSRFATPAAAKAAATALVAAKTEKGYAVGPAASRTKQPPTPPSAKLTAKASAKVTAKRRAAKTSRGHGGGGVETLVAQLDRLTRAYLRGEGDDPDDARTYALVGPPGKADLAAHLTLWPDLPPSYVEFLTRHAGWVGFWGGTSLLGPRTKKNAAQWKTVLRDVSAMDGYLDDDDDPDDPDFVRAKDVIPIAFNDNGGLLAFDRRKPGANGELAVVDCMRTNGCVDNRHRNFAAFLRNRIACTKRWIAKQ